MIGRKILTELDSWVNGDNRKPLVLRGARQVGKTTVVRQFASRFRQFIYLNLELPEDRRPFEQFVNMSTLVEAIFFLKNQSLEHKEDTLLFIDEIQEMPEAINLLRYFYEEVPELPVIAAGSMLETLFDKGISFPVGRVVYKVLRPVSFPEFLGALGENAALEQLQKVPLAGFAHEKLMRLFHTYALIGGMPEIVAHYAAHRDLTALAPFYDSLINSYQEDAEKYATSAAQLQLLRHAIRSIFGEAGKRIKYQGFGNSSYGSREMGEVLRALEKALLLELVHPSTGFTLPLSPDVKKSPRLHILDTGLMNYYLGIQKEIIGTQDLDNVYQGTMIEHLVGQELLASRFDSLHSLHFWVREKKTSSAEVDYLVVHDSKLVPVEVKSGATGALRSLHLFMDEAPHELAIRFYAGEVNMSRITTQKGKTYRLLSLPYYLVSELEHYLDWAQDQG